jgi:OPA family sugar phosphate sensor protein UhpC-like MFS transporter
MLKNKQLKAEIEDPGEIAKYYNYWRWRIFYSIYIGYAICYFTRKSFIFSIPSISTDLNMDKASLGWIASLSAISYGLSKFFSGLIADKANSRYFMALGLTASGILNIIFGMSSSYWIFAVCWALNGWFQALCSCASIKSLTYWYSSSERGRWWGAWNTSHNIGCALVPVIVAYCVQSYGWRYGMFIPAVITFAVGVWTFNRLRDTPKSMGLPTVEKFKNDLDISSNKQDKEQLSQKSILWKYILTNKYIWILAISYFFILMIRTAMNDWTMPYLIEQKGYTYTQAGQGILFFELGGVLGSLFAGWFSDRFFRGTRGQTMLFFVICLLVLMFVFWFSPYRSALLDYIIMGGIGFCVFGPHMLMGISAVELSHKRAAVTSNGLIVWVGNIGAAAAGGPLGGVIQNMGWQNYFFVLTLSVFIMLIVLLPLYSVSGPPKKSLKRT